MHKRILWLIAAMLSLTSCSTINWKEAGRSWRESLCREELKSPCPDPNDPDDPTIDPF